MNAKKKPSFHCLQLRVVGLKQQQQQQLNAGRRIVGVRGISASAGGATYTARSFSFCSRSAKDRVDIDMEKEGT